MGPISGRSSARHVPCTSWAGIGRRARLGARGRSNPPTWPVLEPVIDRGYWELSIKADPSGATPDRREGRPVDEAHPSRRCRRSGPEPGLQSI